MPIILATQKAGIGKIWFNASLGKKLVRPPSQPTAGCSIEHLSSQVIREAEVRRIVDPSQAKK
jgi:hypothetical protein